MTLQEQIEIITGPQLPISDNWFDTTLVTKAKLHGEACPAFPPSDPNSSAFNDFVLLNYYDLAQTEYIAHVKTNDPIFLTYARKAADSWWKHPDIGEGKIQRWPDSVSPVPRHAGILGMLCRAIDGRPEMFPWLTAYTQFHLEHWLKKRVTSPALFYGVREGAFVLNFAACLAKVHPDATVRAQLTADVENVCQNYFGRLQQADGSWRWDDVDYIDSDKGTLKGVTQPFMVGLLLRALCASHQVVTTEAARTSIKIQILNGCRHLYSDGPFTRTVAVNFGVEAGGFHYFYHGGTSVNPTRYVKGDIPSPWMTTERWHVESARQAASTILGPFGYAYLISGEEFFKNAGNEIYRFAYSGSDGFRAMMADTAKNFNQHVWGSCSYTAWLGSAVPSPAPLPTPAPAPAPSPTPPPPPSTKPIVSITSPLSGAVLSGTVTVSAAISGGADVDSIYLIVDDLVMGAGSVAPLSFPLNTTKLTKGAHSMFVRAWDGPVIVGDSERVAFTVSNEAPMPTPTPAPTPPPPAPTPPCAISAPSLFSIPRNGTGVINVTMNNLTQPVTVNVLGSDGQVTVSPLSKTAAPTSSVLAFQVRAKNKKQTRLITFQSSCGSVNVNVNVT